jgi:hypothetical protein
MHCTETQSQKLQGCFSEDQKEAYGLALVATKSLITFTCNKEADGIACEVQYKLSYQKRLICDHIFQRSLPKEVLSAWMSRRKLFRSVWMTAMKNITIQ